MHKTKTFLLIHGRIVLFLVVSLAITFVGGFASQGVIARPLSQQQEDDKAQLIELELTNEPNSYLELLLQPQFIFNCAFGDPRPAECDSPYNYNYVLTHISVEGPNQYGNWTPWKWDCEVDPGKCPTHVKTNTDGKDYWWSGQSGDVILSFTAQPCIYFDRNDCTPIYTQPEISYTCRFRVPERGLIGDTDEVKFDVKTRESNNKACVATTPINTPWPTQAPTPDTSIRIVPTPVPSGSTRPVPAGGIADFETWSPWRRGDEAWGTFTQSQEQVYSGQFAGKLAYNFPAVSNNYVVFRRDLSIPGQSNALQIWVWGDGSTHFLNAWVQDATGQVWQFSFGRIYHANGWQLMTAPLDTTRGWPNQPIGGNPNATSITYPLRFEALVLDGYDESQAFQGVVYFDDLAATSGAPTVATAAAPASTTAPRATDANAVPSPSTPIPPVPATISFRADRTELTAGECTTLFWDVDNVHAVYWEGQGVGGHGSQSVCPASTQDYHLSIERQDGGREERVVTINVNPSPSSSDNNQSSGSNQPPNSPSLVSPGDWSVFDGETPTLCAIQNGDPDGDTISAYRFVIFESAQTWDSGWINSDCANPTVSGYYGYQWRVQVRDSRGAESGWSETWHFNIREVFVPSADGPKLVSPGDWSVFDGQTPTLCTHYDGDLYGRPVTQISFSIYESAQNWESGWVSDTCVTPPVLGYAGYQWHAKARNDQGQESGWSETWHFNIREVFTPSSTSPKLVSPSDWAVFHDETPQLCARYEGTLNGQPVTHLRFAIFESAQNFDSDWISYNGGDLCVPPSSLGRFGYQWHVQARNDQGQESSWSETWHFNIYAP